MVMVIVMVMVMVMVMVIVMVIGDGDGDEQEIEDMIVTVDKNKDGKINYSEFRVGKIKSIKLHI